jgi:magnesium-transporting ATPase (P-type)
MPSKSDVKEKKIIIENELDNKMKNIELLLENNKNLEELRVKLNKLIHTNKDKSKYFNIKKDKIETSKNIANRTDDYNNKDLEFYKYINKIITYLLWAVLFVFIYFYYIKNFVYSHKLIIKIISLLLFVYFIPNITEFFSTKYFDFMKYKSKYYRDLEYRIIEAENI